MFFLTCLHNSAVFTFIRFVAPCSVMSFIAGTLKAMEKKHCQILASNADFDSSHDLIFHLRRHSHHHKAKNTACRGLDIPSNEFCRTTRENMSWPDKRKSLVKESRMSVVENKCTSLQPVSSSVGLHLAQWFFQLNAKVSLLTC